MRKLLMLIGAMIICNAYGEGVAWLTATDGTIYSTTSCNSGDNIAKPENPTKSGYRFIGWREATTDEINTILEQIVQTNGTSKTPTSSDGSTSWTATFPYGTVSGTIRCSSTNGTSMTAGNPSTTNGRYCWCKLTNAEPLSGLINVSSSAWVFRGDSISASNCTPSCATNCASTFIVNVNLRRAAFGVN